MFVPQGHGFGKWLLSDAIHRVVNLADQVKGYTLWFMQLMMMPELFYERFGFRPSQLVALNTLFYKV